MGECGTVESNNGLIIAVQLLGQPGHNVQYKRERERWVSVHLFNSIDLLGEEVFLLQGNLNALANVHTSLAS